MAHVAILNYVLGEYPVPDTFADTGKAADRMTPRRSQRSDPVMDIGPVELLIVLAIVLLLFGSTRLPKLARSLGSAKAEFERGVHESEDTPERPDDA